MLVPTVPGRPRLAASTVIALVLTAGISGLRYTFADIVLVYCTYVTGSIRPIMPGAALGSWAVWPNTVCPLVTVSRFVPSLLISASSPAWEDAESPSTAPIAATPIAACQPRS